MSPENGMDYHLGRAIDLSIEGLRALLYLNGGAAAALIALTGKGTGGQDYAVSISWFGIGAILTTIAFVFGYFSQLAYGNSRNSMGYETLSHHRRHQICQWGAIVVVLLSLLCSGFGGWSALDTAKANSAMSAVSNAPCPT